MSTTPSSTFERNSSAKIGKKGDKTNDLFMIGVQSSFGSLDDSMPTLGRLNTLSTIQEEKRRQRPRGAHHRSCSSAGDVDKLAQELQRQFSTASTVDMNDEDDDYEEDYEEEEEEEEYDEEEDSECAITPSLEGEYMDEKQFESREEQVCARRTDRDSRSSPSSSPRSVIGRSKLNGFPHGRRLSPSAAPFFGIHVESDTDECDAIIRKEPSPQAEAALERSSQSLQESMVPPPPAPPSSPASAARSRRTFSDPTLTTSLPSAMTILLGAAESESAAEEESESRDEQTQSPTTQRRKGHRRQRSMDWSQPLDLSP